MKIKRRTLLNFLACVILAPFLLLLGCTPKYAELPIETIENAASTMGEEALRERKPRLIAITKPEDAQVLENLIYPDTLKTLEGLNYREYFAIAVFQGIKGSTGYDIEVKNVVQAGNTINIYADFTTPDPRQPVGQTIPCQGT